MRVCTWHPIKWPRIFSRHTFKYFSIFFVMLIFFGWELPHSTSLMRWKAISVKRKTIAAGRLIFFSSVRCSNTVTFIFPKIAFEQCWHVLVFFFNVDPLTNKIKITFDVNSLMKRFDMIFIEWKWNFLNFENMVVRATAARWRGTDKVHWMVARWQAWDLIFPLAFPWFGLIAGLWI